MGVTEEQITEVLHVASAMQAGITLVNGFTMKKYRRIKIIVWFRGDFIFNLIRREDTNKTSESKLTFSNSIEFYKKVLNNIDYIPKFYETVKNKNFFRNLF